MKLFHHAVTVCLSLLVVAAMLFARPSHVTLAGGLLAFSVWSGIGSYFLNIFKSLIGRLGPVISQFLHDFVAEDLGKIALDAVAWVSATMQGANDVTARDAAVAQFKIDAAAAGHDITTFGASLLNFFVEAGYQAFQGGVTPSPAMTAKISAATAAK